jgi:prepilin-type processing-associated H-X9-DG protein
LQSGGTMQEPYGGYFGSPHVANKAITPWAITATHFRFAGKTTNVAFLDGHVEVRTPVTLPSVAPFNQTVWDTAAAKWNLGFLWENSNPSPYIGD